jgi:hypothetical protein
VAPLIDADDVTALTKQAYADEDLTQVVFLIAYASGKAREEVPGIDAALAAGNLDPDVVKGVLASVVARALDVLERGHGVISREYPEVKTGYTEREDYEELLYFTNSELNDLTPDSVRTGDAFTIRIMPS